MNIEYITKKFEGISPEGFNVVISKENYISLEKINNTILNKIYCGNLNAFFLTNISSSIIFFEIENILNNKYELGQNNPTIDILGNKFPFKHDYQEILSQLPISLDTEAGIDKACQLIQEYIEQEAIPFFNYWQDIRDFLPFLETKDNGFIADLFSGDGFYKKVIIWKLCSHPCYYNLIEEMLGIFKLELEETPNDKLLKKDYDKYLKIIKTLEKTKPLYEWDEKYLIQKPYIK
ncbi:hypothetical protein BXU11_08320 [Flavobacterium sp. LM5]|nr:hypothetical protein [Flavobacterium sp. LM5]OOV29854.1 hypothetical protein BXU11_08320 [Flavobacterium sp. LM5]